MPQQRTVRLTEEDVMLRVHNNKGIVLGVAVVVSTVFSMSAAYAQSRVKVSGEELRQWFSTYSAFAGYSAETGCVFIVVNHSLSRRDQYFDCHSTTSGIWKGSARIVGDEFCSRWDFDPQERCSLIYRVGAGKYEMREGAIEFYKLK